MLEPDVGAHAWTPMALAMLHKRAALRAGCAKLSAARFSQEIRTALVAAPKHGGLSLLEGGPQARGCSDKSMSGAVDRSLRVFVDLPV